MKKVWGGSGILERYGGVVKVPKVQLFMRNSITDGARLRHAASWGWGAGG